MPARLRIYHRNLLDPTLLVRACEDCACAVANTAWQRPTLLTRNFYSADVFYTTPPAVQTVEDLPDGHSAVFNHEGDGGVVVINPLARQVFDYFTMPHRPTELAQSFSHFSSRELADALTTFYDLGLLLENGMPRPRKPQASEQLTAWLHVTDACNMACPYCYLNKSGKAMDEATGFAAVEAVFRSALAEKFRAVKLKYAGGEATLNFPLILQLHDHAARLAEQYALDLETVVLSNGAAFTNDRIRELKQRNIRVMISLDGLGASHDAQRPFLNGKGSFHAVQTGIERLLAADHKPHLSITLSNRNLEGVAEVVTFALERDLTFSLNFYRENEYSADFADLRFGEQQMIDAILRAFKVIEEDLPLWSILGAVLDRGQLLETRTRPCGVGQDYLVIDHLGGVAKCHMEIEKTVTDVRAHNPLAVVRADLNAAQNPSVEEKEGCRACQWRYWCTGGCPVATFKATGRYDIKSPNCNIYKAIYPEALRLEALRLLKYCPQYLA